MNTMALLCNLHADGLTTLHRLQRAGRDSFETLLETPIETMAEILDCQPAFAERFLREARNLAERTSILELDATERTALGSERPSERSTQRIRGRTISRLRPRTFERDARLANVAQALTRVFRKTALEQIAHVRRSGGRQPLVPS